MTHRFEKRIFLTRLISEVSYMGRSEYKITEKRVEGFVGLTMDILGLSIGFGPTDFKFSLKEEETEISEPGPKYRVYCNYKAIYLSIY